MILMVLSSSQTQSKQEAFWRCFFYYSESLMVVILSEDFSIFLESATEEKIDHRSFHSKHL